MNRSPMLLQNVKRSRCQTCNIVIHPKFLGYHRRGYLNCPGCKITVNYSDYMNHIISHGTPKINDNGQDNQVQKTYKSIIPQLNIDLHEKPRQGVITKPILLRSSRHKHDYLGSAITKEQEKPDVGSYW